MEWRCEWCGKPHEENDPPCDNCGHGSFEEAVIRRASGTEGTRPAATTVWVCTECGRTHTKHAPPCSRCGGHDLIRETQRVGEDELTAPGYLDLLTPRYLLGLGAVLALAAVFLVGLTGAVALPGFGPAVPGLADVPGEADTAGGLELATVEREYVDALNDRRTGAGRGTLTRDGELDAVARFFNQRRIVTEFTDRRPSGREEAVAVLGERCGEVSGVEPVAVTAPLGGVDSERALAEELLERTPEPSVRAESGLTGVDVHAVDGTAYLLGLSC